MADGQSVPVGTYEVAQGFSIYAVPHEKTHNLYNALSGPNEYAAMDDGNQANDYDALAGGKVKAKSSVARRFSATSENSYNSLGDRRESQSEYGSVAVNPGFKYDMMGPDGENGAGAGSLPTVSETSADSYDSLEVNPGYKYDMMGPDGDGPSTARSHVSTAASSSSPKPSRPLAHTKPVARDAAKAAYVPTAFNPGYMYDHMDDDNSNNNNSNANPDAPAPAMPDRSRKPRVSPSSSSSSSSSSAPPPSSWSAPPPSSSTSLSSSYLDVAGSPQPPPPRAPASSSSPAKAAHTYDVPDFKTGEYHTISDTPSEYKTLTLRPDNVYNAVEPGSGSGSGTGPGRRRPQQENKYEYAGATTGESHDYEYGTHVLSFDVDESYNVLTAAHTHI